MENLNAEQIVKALEYCKSPKLTKCDGCPREKEDGHCMYRLNEDALSLINSQEQRIKKLTQAHEMLSESYDHLEKTKDYLLAEKSRLTKDNASLHASCTEFEQKCASVKSRTVRKMQEEIQKRCIAGGIYPAFVARTIDQIAKEMIGDGK